MDDADDDDFDVKFETYIKFLYKMAPLQATDSPYLFPDVHKKPDSQSVLEKYLEFLTINFHTSGTHHFWHFCPVMDMITVIWSGIGWTSFTTSFPI